MRTVGTGVRNRSNVNACVYNLVSNAQYKSTLMVRKYEIDVDSSAQPVEMILFKEAAIIYELNGILVATKLIPND